MRTVGFNKPLYFLSFDHRLSFQTKLFGWTGKLTIEQTAQIGAAKQVIYDAFKIAVALGVPKDRAGILVDEQFGSIILRDAVGNGYMTACPVEKSGQEEFDFEYGDDFARHIEAFHATFCKVLVRYNAEGDRALNQRQAVRLARLSDYLHERSSSLFMFELLVPPDMAQLFLVHDDRKAYDLQIRSWLMAEAIQRLQDAGVEPDVWKVEGLDSRDDCQIIVAAAHRGGREDVGCIVLGRGEDDLTVREWLTTASTVEGFTGFALGRPCFWDPLVAWRQNKIGRPDAVAEIVQRYREFVDIFEERLATHREPEYHHSEKE